MPTAEVNGISINYRVAGNGFPIVFAHGHSGRLRNWALQRSLADRFQMISLDHRGHGESSSPTDPAAYSIELMADDLYQTIQSIGVAECYLVGHSMGGMIALEFALAHQDLPRGLVLVDTAPAEFRMNIFEEADELERIARARGLAGVFEHNLSRNPVMAMEIAKAPGNHEVYRREYQANNVDGYLNTLQAMRRRRSLVDRLGDIRVPTLILVGERDEPFLEPARVMHAGIPGSELLTFADCGHSPQIEFPERFNAVLIDFIERVDRRRTAGGASAGA